jgi:hypothetical protein
VLYTEQAAVLLSSNDHGNVHDKRQLDSNARALLPVFRGSNLSMFVRKRPTLNGLTERGLHRQQEKRARPVYDESFSRDFVNDGEQPQRRFDEYSENPGPMFG